MKKIIIAPDSFKGTMSAAEVANIIKAEGERCFPEANIIALPIADGGEGSLEAFNVIKGGTMVFAEVSDPFMRKTKAKYLLIQEDTAVIETAEAIGLPLAGKEKNPMFTSSYGVGELILAAVERGVKNIILTLGGSSTNDGGIGMAIALGVRCYNKMGEEFLPRGKDLISISRIDLSSLDKRLSDITFTAMCDVDATITGAEGASYVFAPQKGAREQDLPLLDKGLDNLRKIIKGATGADYVNLKGGGAAGGLGMGAKAFLQAELKSGIDVVLSLADFDNLLNGADMVISGEGKLDRQSLMGKVVFGITRYTKIKGIPLYIVCGVNELNSMELAKGGIKAVYPTKTQELPIEQIKLTARQDLLAAARQLFEDVRL